MAMNDSIGLLKITDKNKITYYGGDQDWYSSNTRAMAGCSSVAAANALRMLTLTDPECRSRIRSSSKMPAPVRRSLLSVSCEKDDFLVLMTGVYETMRSFELFPLNLIYDRCGRKNKFFHILKPNNGRSSIGFIRGILIYASRLGLNLKYNALPTAFMDKETSADFIKTGLERSGSVVILTSYNSHPLKVFPTSATESVLSRSYDKTAGNNSVMKCHFATITGINDTDVYISTWGKIAVVSIDDLVESWHSIKAWESTLFYFTPADDTSEMRKNLFASPLPFIKGILHAIIRR